MSAPRYRSRAHNRALKVAMEPPAVKSPRVVSGNPIQSRSQSSALASSCTSAGAGLPDPGVPVRGVGDEVRQRRGEDAAAGNGRPNCGAGALKERGMQSSNSWSSNGSSAQPASGTGSRSSRQNAPALTSPSTGCAPSEATCAIDRAVTALAMRRISSTENSRF